MGKIILGVTAEEQTKLLHLLDTYDTQCIASFTELQSVLNDKDIFLLIIDPIFLRLKVTILPELLKRHKPFLPCIIILDQKYRLPPEQNPLDFTIIDTVARPIDKTIIRLKANIYNNLRISENQIYSHDIIGHPQFMTTWTGNSIEALSHLVNSHTMYLFSHMQRTSSMMELLATKISSLDLPGYRLSTVQLENLAMMAPLHDIGKFCIPEPILNKTDKLTCEEFEIMKHHVVCGMALLLLYKWDIPTMIQKLSVAKDIILFHHQWYDGKGYPYFEKGQDIPLAGRLMAVIDVYDALTSKRPYKPAYPSADAIELIANESNTHFDPIIVDALIGIRKEIHEIAEKE
jgi:putative two-component system response regulator